MENVRLGVIGATGGIAEVHQSYFADIPGLEHAAVCARTPDALDAVAQKYGAKAWTDGEALIRSGRIDAVFIACPHTEHPKYCHAAFEHGVHVLCEKPIAVSALEAEEVNLAYQAARKIHPKLIFAAMFNRRTDSKWSEIKHCIDGGRLGEIVRVSWTITSWFRTQAYYESSDWRATWAGEGGGVLINQCSHNLDLLWWMVGMPSRVTARASLGKYHQIEVEDEVAAILEWPNGAMGTFVTTTGQSPGINRLEIVGTRGTAIADAQCDEDYRVYLSDSSVQEFIMSDDRYSAQPEFEISQIKSRSSEYSSHERVTRNFIETIRSAGTQDQLIAPGCEGIHGLEIGNAILMSGLSGESVRLPMDRKKYDQFLHGLHAH